VADRAGPETTNTNFPAGGPMAANLAAAYFPFSQGWIGATAYNSADGGSFTELVGSLGLQLGTHLIQDDISAGRHRVIIPGVQDSRRQGLLFVNHAKNENNYAMSEPADDGNGWVLTGHDNMTTTAAGELDPVSFVFLPLGTPNVTMARIHPSSGQDLQPTAMLQSGQPFTIVRDGPLDLLAEPYTIGGRYRLSIPGESPNSGVLLVSPSGQGRGAGGANTNNIVTYEADGNDWIITSQDLRDLNESGEWSRERISYFNFAFIPFDSPPTAPAPIPAPNFTRQRIIGWNTQITHESAGGGHGETFATVTERTADVPIQGLSENSGDYGFSVDGDFLTTADGVLFATVNQGLRNNAPTGGFFEYGFASAGLFVPEWIVFTDSASPSPPTPGEHEINFASAFFGAESGFTMATNVTADSGRLNVAIPDVTDSRTDGVLFAQAWDNEDNYALVSPTSNGSGWDIELHDDGTTFETDELNYVYLPFDSENLVAARVDEDGSLLASTEPSEFTLTRETAGSYLLSIPGKSPETGMLLLNGTGETGSIDNILVYETAGANFRILGLDTITNAEATAGTLVNLEDTEFSFAYIDFNAPLTPPGTGGLTGDYNNDGSVDAADYVVWRKQNINGQDGYNAWRANFGRTTGGAAVNQAAVPEPATMFLFLLGASMTCILLNTHRRAAR
jgi:hypothetical protein